MTSFGFLTLFSSRREERAGVVKGGGGGGSRRGERQAEGWGGFGLGGGGFESVEPAGLNSTAEPVTPTIHQCRGVTRQGQGYVTGGGGW